jgi:hypothetical protein
MPRKSSEAQAAAVWRSGGRPPAPPAHLSRDAKRLWRSIVASRAPDHFGPGTLELLEQFVVVSTALRELGPRLTADPMDRPTVTRWSRLAGVQATLATKLRLATSSRWRAEDGRLTETQPAGAIGRLLGGEVVKIR